jgi:hypothetical protein
MIDSAGLILSTSRDLGNAPVVDFTIEGGASGSAWTLGRDDARDIVIFEILDPQGPYPSINMSSEALPTVGSELAVLSYPNGRAGSLERLNTRIIGVRQDFNTGAFYLQLQAQAQAGAQGGALVGTAGELVGLRMREEHMIALGFGRVGEVYVMASDALLENTSRLRSGYLQTSAGGGSGSEKEASAPPAIPVIYHGTVSIGGMLAAEKTKIYTKLSKGDKPDLWYSTPVDANGKYVMAVQAASSYNSGTVEFWAQAKKANETSIHLLLGSPHSQDITFP